MKYIIHNIWKGNAPPKGRGNPYFIVISKEGRLRDLLQQSSAVTDSSPDESEFGMTRAKGSPLLNMRDGPHGRISANSLAMDNGLVTLIQKSSVSLCEISENFVVKKLKSHRTQRKYRERRVIYILFPIKTFGQYCTVYVRMQEEKPMMEEWNIRMPDCHPERTCPD
nr:hypothetical protein [uncultured Draconibacterium sp.]